MESPNILLVTINLFNILLAGSLSLATLFEFLSHDPSLRHEQQIHHNIHPALFNLLSTSPSGK